MKLTQYGIYLAKVHFDDKPEIYKVRPVLILDCKDLLVLTLKMTSNLEQKLYDCFQIQKWQECGLGRPTSIILDPPYILDEKDVFADKFIGKLDNYDLENLFEVLNSRN